VLGLGDAHHIITARAAMMAIADSGTAVGA
jgi:hypothetical protein